MTRESFVFRRCFYERAREMCNIEERGILFDAVYDYALNDIYPKNLPPMLLMAFAYISPIIDRDYEMYIDKVERNRQNGKKGGRPKNSEEQENPSGFFGIPEKPKKPDSVSVSDSYSVKRSSKNLAFTPPTRMEVVEFFNSKGSSEELARRAYEHYETGNWLDSRGVQVKNWRQKMLTNWINRSSFDLQSSKMDKVGQIIKRKDPTATILT